MLVFNVVRALLSFDFDQVLVLLIQVAYFNLVILAIQVPAFPLDNVQTGANESKDDHAGQVHTEAFKNAELASVDIIGVATNAQYEHEHEVGAVSAEPEKQEVGTVRFIVDLSLLLDIEVGREGFRAGSRGRRRPVTPGYVMQVAH